MKKILTLGLFLALLAGAPTQPLNGQGAPRLVAIGDIHGAIAEFKSILKTTGLADDSGRWTGGKAVLMQTGDYMDRGAGTRAVLDLLMALERQAKDAGGRVVAVLGNHEAMNLIGETRDVTPEILATFADAQSESRRQAAWEQYAKLAAAKTAKGEAVPAVYQQTRDAWLAIHPPGYVEYREAVGPRGPVRRLASRQADRRRVRRLDLHARRHRAEPGAGQARRSERPRARRGAGGSIASSSGWSMPSSRFRSSPCRRSCRSPRTRSGSRMP